MNLKPKSNHVLLEPLPVQEKSHGGIFLPQAQTGDYCMFYKVLAVGEPPMSKKGVPLPPDFGVADVVVTPLNYSHTTIEDSTNRKIVSFDQIIAKFE